jgi:hypothetical protein
MHQMAKEGTPSFLTSMEDFLGAIPMSSLLQEFTFLNIKVIQISELPKGKLNPLNHIFLK